MNNPIGTINDANRDLIAAQLAKRIAWAHHADRVQEKALEDWIEPPYAECATAQAAAQTVTEYIQEIARSLNYDPEAIARMVAIAYDLTKEWTATT